MRSHCNDDFKPDYWAGVGEKLPWNARPGSSARVGGIPWETINHNVISADYFS